jgi:transcriptional regulator of acetoin/glycerol metabolism
VKIKIDKLAAQEIFLDYAAKKINSTDASEKLGISKSTFLRRYREYENARH